MRRLGFFVLAYAFFLLTACGRQVPTPGTTPTPLLAEAGETTVLFLPAPTPTSTLEPLRFTLPTVAAEPRSGWRPPLYPVPWAPSLHDHFYFIRPIPADQVNWPVADYRYGGTFFGDVVHSGVDIPAEAGSPVLAAGDGVVIWADWGLFSGAPGNDRDPYGMAVAIRHDFGYQGKTLYTIYAHLSRIETVVGRVVKRGEEIGKVGDTGMTTGPHLHFEVRWGENSFFKTYNPELWMVPPQGRGVLVARLANARDEPLTALTVTLSSITRRAIYTVRTYGPRVVNPDPYYRENLVLSDLPADVYKVTFEYDGEKQQYWVRVLPGRVTYFRFQGNKGFFDTPPTVLPEE
ncbi:MAG: M23 family metallopeptidase [Anaerolineales bacterium]